MSLGGEFLSTIRLSRVSLSPEALPTNLQQWVDLLERVSKAYSDSDQERYLMERSLQISSKEMQERWQALNMEKARTLHAEKFSTLGEMAGSIAHEINNPVGLIGVLTGQLKDLAKEGGLTEDILSDHLSQIEEGVWRIAKIIKALRGFSRDGSKDPFLAVQIKKIIDDVQVFCSERFRQHDIAFTIEKIDPDMKADCREVEIVQVLLNLLNNAFDAIQALPDKWIKLSIQETNDEIVFSVTNSGDKIPSEVQKKLFQPFFTTKEIGKGTGLGLSISKKIAENHGGSLEYLDNNSHSCFVFKILKAHKSNKSSTV